MRFSTVVISSAFVLAGMSTARPVGSDFEVEARAFDEESELYARGGAMSKLTGKKKDKLPSYHTASRDPPPHYEGSPNHVPHLDSFRTETDYSHNHKSPAGTSRHRRRSYYPSNDYELVARGHGPSKIGGGDKERKDGKPPKYKVVAKDPVPPYEGSPDHVPFLDSFQTETDYSNNPKTPSGTQARPHGSQSGHHPGHPGQPGHPGHPGHAGQHSHPGKPGKPGHPGNSHPRPGSSHGHGRRSFYDLD
ncbi:hypothetical protein M378DRAFT_27732 [Amanita muscaria Koide BX008]|uniref:Uncharacterized protein n=1 Tax=Amanita muscaria (strain Koide BX008) TaxID=946122 RepID=A0A0C2WA30_AMAMK|nr:hypothetical protein M378DRAFT_27732 [Amanita muscaria Koide BX008]